MTGILELALFCGNGYTKSMALLCGLRFGPGLGVFISWFSGRFAGPWSPIRPAFDTATPSRRIGLAPRKIPGASLEIGDQCFEGQMQSTKFADQNIIPTLGQMVRTMQPDQFPQSALYPIAHNRIANFLGDGEANPRRFVVFRRSTDRLKHKTATREANSLGRG